MLIPSAKRKPVQTSWIKWNRKKRTKKFLFLLRRQFWIVLVGSRIVATDWRLHHSLFMCSRVGFDTVEAIVFPVSCILFPINDSLVRFSLVFPVVIPVRFNDISAAKAPFFVNVWLVLYLYNTLFGAGSFGRYNTYIRSCIVFALDGI